MLVSVVLTSSRVLSRIFQLVSFFWGGEILSHVVEEKTFGLSRGVRGHASLENFENIAVFRIG